MADPVHQFVIQPIIPIEIAGYDLSFTNSSLWMMIAVVTSTTFLLIASRRKDLIPGRVQAVAEMLYEFIANMIRENTGSEGRQYFPLIFTLFIVVLMGNLLGLMPYSFTYTSHIAVTFALAAMVFLTVTIFGFIKHGTKFLGLFAPHGVPFYALPLIVPIEVLSFCIRPMTLSVRLFANMMAGHLLLKVFAGFSVMMVGALGTVGIFAGVVPMLFNVAMLCLELLVSLLQAYIFTILSCIYLKDTIEIEH